MTKHFDIIIIGGGNAGFGVSAVASDAGKSLAFIEEWDFGGTCPNRGCTPKKVLVAAAHAMHEIEMASAHGIEVGKPKLNWKKLINREKDMIDFIPGAMHGVAEKRGTVFRGTAKFIDDKTVEVNGEQLTGDNIVIATGSKPRPLSMPGSEFMITSNEVLSEDTLPDEVVFIGGGVIALEFAHVYARAGSKVTILEVTPQLLPRMDADAVNVIKAETERLGVTVKTGVDVKKVEKTSNGLSVTYTHDGKDHTANADRVVNGAGRVANVDDLNLGAANIKHDGIRIDVDEYLNSTSNPRIWVAGDALVGPAQLSPIATHEGKVVAHNIVNGSSKKPDYFANPSAVYTVPALSTVGLTEQEAKDQGLDVNVTTSDITGWFSSKTYAESAAWSKVIVDKKTDQIVGAHIVGHNGEDSIHLISFAMRQKIKVADLKESPMAFPTFAYDIKSMM